MNLDLPDLDAGQLYAFRVAMLADRIESAHLIDPLEIELRGALLGDVVDTIASEINVLTFLGFRARPMFDRLDQAGRGALGAEGGVADAERLLVGARCMLLVAVCAYTTEATS